MVKIFWEFLVFDQIFLSPQVKQSVIISNKHAIYQLRKDIEILKSKEISIKYHNFMQLWPHAQPSLQKENFLNTCNEDFWKIESEPFPQCPIPHKI